MKSDSYLSIVLSAAIILSLTGLIIALLRLDTPEKTITVIGYKNGQIVYKDKKSKVCFSAGDKFDKVEILDEQQK